MNCAKTLQAQERLRLRQEKRAVAQRRAREIAESRRCERKLPEAVKSYRKLVWLDPSDTLAWQSLALCYAQQGRYESAIHAQLDALRACPAEAALHFQFGMLLRRFPGREDLEHDYLTSTRLGNRFTPGRQPPGPRVVSRRPLLAFAAQLSAFLSRAPGVDWDLYHALGNLRMALLEIPQAVRAYQKARSLDPQNPIVLRGLAMALRLQGKSAESALFLGESFYQDHQMVQAIPQFLSALGQGLRSQQLYLNLARAYNAVGRHADAARLCRAAVQRYPKTPEIYRVWILALESRNQVEAVVKVAAAAARLFPGELRFAHERFLSLPMIYRSQRQLQRCRDSFREGIGQLAKALAQARLRDRKRLWGGIRHVFPLAYQGMNDRPLMKRYGELVAGVMRRVFPAWSTPRPMRRINCDGRIRVGYVSAGMNWGSIGSYLLGWLEHHRRDQFDICAYYLGDEIDALTSAFQQAAGHFHHFPTDLEAACRQIIADNLHVLVFLEVGLRSRTTRMAGLRLAPIQCAALGHPVTTGLPTMDYFISNELMEPRNADKHYSERLVRLSGLGMCIQQPFLPPVRKRRSQFALPESVPIYLSPLCSSKYLPQYDHVFPAIAAQVPGAQFVFVADDQSGVPLILRQRLTKAFSKAGLAAAQYLMYLPPQPYHDFLDLLRASDVFLDTFGWSGGLTTLDALNCGIPVVTRPGEFLRGRQSAGFLVHLEVTETIAASPAHYIRIAARLGQEADWRQRISRKIIRRRHRLYQNLEGLRSLEGFYQEVVRRSAREVQALSGQIPQATIGADGVAG